MSLNLDEGKKSPSFEISNRRPKKITTMTPEDAERHSPEAKSLHKKAQAAVSLPKIKTEAKDHEHSMARSEIHKIDNAIKTLRKKVKGEGNLEAWVQSKITRAADYLDAVSNYLDSGEHNQVEEGFDDNVPELRSRTVTDSSSTGSSRRSRKSPGEIMRMLNQDNPPTTKPKKKKKKLKEETMTPEQKAKEEKLKQKYDDSEMKQNMIDQYGKERGTQIYFAKIRKMAMKEGFIDPEDEIPTSTGRPGRKPIENVAEHPNPRVRRKAVEAMRKQMEKEYGGKWKTKSKDPAVEEDYKPLPAKKMLKKAGDHNFYAGWVQGEWETNRYNKRTKKPITDKMVGDATKKANKIYDTVLTHNPDSAKSKSRYKPSSKVEEDFDYLDEAKLSRTARRAARAGKPGYDAEGKPKPKGKVRAWDMDETLMRNDPKKIRVHVKDKEGKTVQSLTNQEFNVHKLDKDKGHSYDFSDFRSSEKFKQASTPNKSMIKKLKKQVRRGKPVHIVTARGSFDDQPKFAQHLRRHGIEIDPGKGKGGRYVHVHRAGDMPGSDIGQKKVDIVKGLMKQHGTSGGEMYDDAAKVHKAFKKSGLKVKTKMVQPNKKDVTQARSFREEIDLDLIYDFILEQFILENIAEDYEDASLILEELDDELLEDLIAMSHNFIQTTLEEDLQMTEERELKIDYQSPYKKIQEKREIKKDYLQEEVELTPYEYWKSFIGDEEEVEIVNEEVETEELVEEVEMTSYEKWKQFLT